MSSSKPDDKPWRPNWLTISAAGVVVSVGLYVYTIGSEIGAMRQMTANQEFRITALEQHGSGPVQANAAKVDAVIQRSDRILTELLNMQQRISDLTSTQQRQGAVLDRVQQDLSAQSRAPDKGKD
jgi:hypothetical protein